MTTDQNIRETLVRATASLPKDVERRLDDLHRGIPRRERRRRVGVIAVAATLSLVVVLAIAQLRPSGDAAAVGGPTPTGRIAVTRVVADPAGDGAAQVEVVQAGSGTVDARSEGPNPEYFPVWSPDGTRLAFATGLASEDQVGIRVTDADGGSSVTIDAGKVEFVAWSPDGRRLAYIHSQAGSVHDDPDGVNLVDADGTNRVLVHEGSWQSVSWSPDGQHLLLTGWPTNPEQACPPGCTDLYTVRPDGSGLTQLTDGETYVHYAVWSPDGTRIAFVRSPEFDNVDYRSDIFVMAADGSGTTRITDWKGFDSFPVWSPDGSWLVFASDRDATPAQAAANADGAFGNIGLYVMAPDGSDVHRMVAGSDGVALLPSSWAP